MNYLSRPYQVEQPIQRGDLNIDFQVLNTLQTRYDANKAIVDQTIAQYEMLRGIRDYDNEYIANKVAEVKSQIDSYGNLRFEHKSTVDSISKVLQNVIKDPIVRDAVYSKAVKDNFDTEVSELKKKDPSKYDDRNYAFSLYQGGFEDYKAGKSKKLNNLSYIPYTDMNEEGLKRLKTVKDIKGKRHIEEIVDEYGNLNPNGKYKRTREIDGLTEQEINNYFGNLLTPQELQQLKINGWAKYAQPNTIEPSKKLYTDYTNQQIKNKESLLLDYEANAKNKNLGDTKNKEFAKRAEELRYDIENLKKTDINKISPDEIAFELEKLGYVNSISNMAAAEWNVSLDTNEVYYKDRELELDQMKYDLDVKKYELEKVKLKAEFGVDESGNPLVDENVAMSTREGEHEDVEAGLATKGKYEEYAASSQGIVSTIREFLKNAPQEDKDAYLKGLKARGINSDLQFEKEGYKGKYSLENTLYEVFEKGGFASTYSDYGNTLLKHKTEKTRLAKEITTVESEGYSKLFNKDPDKYVDNFLDIYSYASSVNMDTAVKQFEEFFRKISGKSMTNDEKIALEFATGSFIGDRSKFNTKIKDFLKNNPKELSTFANSMEKLLKTAQSNRIKNPIIFDSTLKEDARAEIDNVIKAKTNEGAMTSIFNDFTFRNDKRKEEFLKMIPNERTFIKGRDLPYNLDRTKTANISFYKRGENIVVVQEQENKEKTGTIVTETVLDRRDAAYQQAMLYVDFQTKKQGIEATANTSLPPVKVMMTSHKNDEVTRKGKERSVYNTIIQSPNLAPVFAWIGGNSMDIEQAAAFAAKITTKEGASQIINNIMTTKGFSEQETNDFRTKLLNNINTFKPQVKTVRNSRATGFEFAMDVKKGDNTVLYTTLNTNTIDDNTNYLINYHPQVFIISELLRTVNKDNFDNYINNF